MDCQTFTLLRIKDKIRKRAGYVTQVTEYLPAMPRALAWLPSAI